MSSKNFQNIQEAYFSFTLWCDDGDIIKNITKSSEKMVLG